MTTRKSRKSAQHTVDAPKSTTTTTLKGLKAASTISPTNTTIPSNNADEERSNIPISSEGPTLPIIGTEAGQEQTTGLSNVRTHEKRKLDDEAPTKQLKKTKAETPRTDLGLLYEPWNFLPSVLRKSLPSGWEKHVLPVVYTRNQNIKSGLNKLKTYLGFSAPLSDVSIDLKSEKMVIAMIAQGEATTKLAGIVGMVKRIVNPDVPGVESKSKALWYMYTALSSRMVTRKQKPKRRGENGEAEPAFETLLEIQQNDKQKKPITEPVLTVWMSRKRIAEFRDALGEQTFSVQQTKFQD
jgi:hypothetical protein